MNYDWFREIPVEIPTYWADSSQPRNEYEALMQCAPHQNPRPSGTERLRARDATAAAFAVLTAEEVWVINALLIERMSLRQLARQLGSTKSTMARIRDRALKKLRNQLQDNPDVQSVLREMSVG